MSETELGDDGITRCSWGASPPDYRDYHDTEWAFGEADDQRLFEKVCLEGFQAGLSWLTILRKRDRFRTVFAGFDPAVVRTYDDADVERLVADTGIIRHEGKIRSTINNAGRAIELAAEYGSLADYFWQYADLGDNPPAALPAVTATSKRLAKDLKRRGWSFVGPTTMYALMQAMGLVNDHFDECGLRAQAQSSRVAVCQTITAR